MQIIYLSIFISVLVIAVIGGFILIKYYDKDKAIYIIDIKIVDSLPVENISEHTMYVLKDNDTYNKYLFINDSWQKIE